MASLGEDKEIPSSAFLFTSTGARGEREEEGRINWSRERLCCGGENGWSERCKKRREGRRESSHARVKEGMKEE